jgi:hypothetical protein
MTTSVTEFFPGLVLQKEAPYVLKRRRQGNDLHIQAIPSFGFIAGDNGVAPKKLQVHRFLDNQFRARSSRNGSLETMKAFVVKKNFQSHC